MDYLKFGTALLAIGLFSFIGYKATEVYRNNNSFIATKGVSDRIVLSDEAVLSLEIYNDADLPKEVAEKRKQDKETVLKFLKENSVEDSEIREISCHISQRYRDKDTAKDVKKYKIYDKVVVKSNQPKKIEKLIEKISNLLDAGLYIESDVEYFYKNIGDLRIEMIEEAAKDSMNRANRIADIAGVRIKGVKNFSTGVFSISSESSSVQNDSDYSWDVNRSLKKRIRVVVHGSYGIE